MGHATAQRQDDNVLSSLPSQLSLQLLCHPILTETPGVHHFLYDLICDLGMTGTLRSIQNTLDHRLLVDSLERHRVFVNISRLNELEYLSHRESSTLPLTAIPDEATV